jgi:hypothetical protein
MTGNLFALRVLSSIYEKPATRPSTEPLQPIVPGAWAAWAKSQVSEPVAPTTAGKAAGPVISLTPVAR